MDAPKMSDTPMEPHPDTQTPPTKKSRAWMLWVTLAGIAIALAVLTVVELILRMAGVGTSLDFFQVKNIDGQRYYVPNQAFYQQFSLLPLKDIMNWDDLDFQVPAQKAPNACRIFVFGESAIYGIHTSSRILETMLNAQFPNIKFEVYNTACPGMNSNVLYPAAKACARLQPDLFLIYMGNNEVVGPYGPNTLLGHIPCLWHPQIIRAMIELNSLRLVQAVSGANQKEWHLPPPNEFAKYRPSLSDHARTNQHFIKNMQYMTEAAYQAGAASIVCTLAHNWRFGEPPPTVHPPDLNHYKRSPANQLIADFARQSAQRRIRLADIEMAIIKQSPENIPGFEFFCDNIHFNFEGNYVAASAMFDQVLQSLPMLSAGQNADLPKPLPQTDCAQRLGWTPAANLALINIQYQVIRDAQSKLVLQAQKERLEAEVGGEMDAKIIEGYRQAVAITPGDIHLQHQLFLALLNARQWPLALDQARVLYAQFPAARISRRALGQGLDVTGNGDAAREAFIQSLALYPDDMPSQVALQLLEKNRAQKDQQPPAPNQQGQP